MTPQISMTSISNDVNHRLGVLAMSALFTQEQISEICMVAKERGVSAIAVIQEAVLSSLY